MVPFFIFPKDKKKTRRMLDFTFLLFRARKKDKQLEVSISACGGE